MRFHFRETVSIACFALTTLYSLSASAEKYQWKSADAPPPRNSPTVGYDRERSRLVVFGGRGPSGTLNDTWEWDGLTWSPRAVAVPPAARANASTFFDTVSKRVTTFGGASVSTAFGDAWSWNGSSWSSIPFAGAQPPLRANGACSFDSVRKKWVLFSGMDSSGIVLDDTWELDATTHVWQKMAPATVPVGRQFAGMAFDPVRQKMLLTGGLNFATATQVLDDTWEWDGTNWVQPGYTGFTVSEFHMMAYDEMRSKMVAFVPLSVIIAGSPNPTYELDVPSKEWKIVVPATTNPAAAQVPAGAYDPVRKRVVMYMPDALGSALWEWDGVDWLRRGPGAGPSGRGFPSVTYDSDNKKLLYFGGTTGVGMNDLWENDGSGWRERFTASAKPPPRFQAQFAYDSLHHYAVVYGGETPSGTDFNTWLWDGTNWTQKVTAHTPPDTRSGAMTFDSARGKTVLVSNTIPLETWEFDGTDWTQKITTTTPSARYFPALVFDPIRGKTIMFGGGTDGFVANGETWEYDGTNWTQRSPATSPSPRAVAKAVFDYSRGKVIMFGGLAGGAAGFSSTFYNEVWEWDGTDWRQLDADKPPITVAAAINLGYDGSHVALVGAATDGSSVILIPKTDTCTVDADCANGTYCVDSVCCQSIACNACETCNGTTPGVCSPVYNAVDSDTCGGTSSCSDKGACLAATGAECTDGSTCASGFCVDGVCCDSACDGTCVACRDSLKEENSRNGLCGPSKAGVTEAACEPSDPSTCGQDGTCDGRAQCAKYAKGTTCGADYSCTTETIASGRVCDGLGVCGASPQPIDCAGFKCAPGTGCKKACEATSSSADCASGYRCSSGECKLTSTSACADETHEYTDDVNAKSCGAYKCRGQCLSQCTSVDDCADGFACGFDGKCVALPDSGCLNGDCGASTCDCSVVAPASSTPATTGIALGAFAAIGAAWGRRRRAARR